MNIHAEFKKLSTCPIADALDRKQVIDFEIKPLWHPMPRISGPAYTVRCASGDNLMMHAAIHQAPAGSIIIVQSDDNDYAVAGGNVCAVAQKRGIAGFVIDGVIRDFDEIKKSQFPVFSRGLVPKPGRKNAPFPINAPIKCGGVELKANDIIVADQDGIVVVPQSQAKEVLLKAKERSRKDEVTSLDEWESAHEEKIFTILKAKDIHF